MNVLLAYLCNYGDRRDFFLSLLPYGLVSMAAYLRSRGIDVTLANFSQEGHRKAAAGIRAMRPDVLGVSIFSFNRTESLKLVDAVAHELPGTVIVAGGPFATHMAGPLLERYPSIVHIVEGEGEESFYGLVADLEKGIPRERLVRGGRIKELDRLPPASAYDGPSHGVNWTDQLSFIITSRGCPGSCVYCCSPRFWGRAVRLRSAVNIADEIEELHRKRGIIYFSIRDDTFTLRKGRVLEFAREIVRRRLAILWNCQARIDSVDLEMLVAMKRAGLEHIQYGIESGSPRVLEMMNKNIPLDKIETVAAETRKAGLLLSVYFMAGMPGEKDEDIAASVKLIRRIRPHDGIVSPVAIYPGTALHDGLMEQGSLADDVWFHREESGLYARDDRAVQRWVKRLAGELAAGERKNRYTHRDFAAQRKVSGEDCWTIDLMEGDLYLDEGDEDRAMRCYGNILKPWPDNLWANLRMGEARRMTGDTDSALSSFSAAAEALPAYYGSWMEMALLHDSAGNKKAAGECAARALESNPQNRDVQKLYGKLHREK